MTTTDCTKGPPEVADNTDPNDGTDTEDAAASWEARVQIVRRYYQSRGYRVHSGFQFGCELVLYADDPSKVHSDYCVHVVPEDGLLDWRMIQALVRLMPDLHKTLLLATLQEDGTVMELAMTSEHAQFRQKHLQRVSQASNVGHQRKRQRPDAKDSSSTPDKDAEQTP